MSDEGKLRAANAKMLSEDNPAPEINGSGCFGPLKCPSSSFPGISRLGYALAGRLQARRTLAYLSPRWTTRRRFDPSSSPSASLPQTAYSPREFMGIKPSSGSYFSFELRTPSQQGALIILQKAHLSPKLCTPRMRYGYRNSNVSKGV